MLETAVRAAREAGSLLLDAGRQEIEIDRKERRDVKLAMDRKAEETIIAIVRGRFPHHSILSEECGRIGGDSEYVWVIDPLDGTFNYSRRVPLWCTSIALKKDDEIIVGVIYDPVREELFSAEKGKGAFLNGEPMQVSETDSLAYATVSFGAGPTERSTEATMSAACHIGMIAAKVRGLGTAAVHVAYVAAGRMDAFFEYGINEWDIAAGLVLLSEAGGVATTRRFASNAMDIAISNGRFHAELLKEIAWDKHDTGE